MFFDILTFLLVYQVFLLCRIYFHAEFTSTDCSIFHFIYKKIACADCAGWLSGIWYLTSHSLTQMSLRSQWICKQLMDAFGWENIAIQQRNIQSLRYANFYYFK